MAKTRIRTVYVAGDKVILRKDTAPKYALAELEKNPHYNLLIVSKTYNGYRINVMDSRTNRQITHWELPTKAISKGTSKSMLISLLETKQTQMTKTIKEMEAEIQDIKDQLTLMNELGVEKIDELDLEYAQKFASGMGISLAEAYKSLQKD